MKKSSVTQLDELFKGVESLLIEGTRSDGLNSRGEAATVQRLIARQLSGSDLPRATTKPNAASLTLIRKLDFLREIGKHRPELRARVALAFKDNERPSRAEIDALIEQLIQSGDLKKTN